ncbi:MAG: hypothetical protein R3A79_11665 [Nannocystaceae bacterium]
MPDRPRGAESGGRLGPLTLGLVAAALLLGVPYFEAIRNANERPRLLQGIALVECGQWAIDGPSARGLSPGPDISRSPVDGRLYPNKPPATSVVAATAYAAARIGEPPTLRSYTMWARLLGGWLPTVLLCFWALRRFTPGLGAAPVAAAIALYALGTPAAAYAHLLYGHQLAAALLICGAVTCVDAAGEGRRGAAATGGALAGLSVAVEYGAAFAGLPIAVALAAVWVAGSRSGGRSLPAILAAILAAIGGALVPAALVAAYHAAVFGSPWATGYHHVVNPDFAAKHGQGLLGLGLPTAAGIHEHLLAADTGLLWWAPLVVVGFAGLVMLARENDAATRRAARVLLGILGLFLLLTVSLSFTGGWRIGPRYVVVALPAMIPGLARVLAAGRARAWILASVAALATWSFVLNGLAANLWPHLDPTSINVPFGEVLVPLARSGAEPYDVLSALGAGDLPLALLVGGTTAAAGLLSLAQIARGSRRRWGALFLGVAVGVLALAASMRLPAHLRAAANLRYIERVWEPKSGVAGPTARLDPLAPGTARCGGAGG